MKLFFRELGDGDPIIILHGLYGMSDNWLSIGKALSTHYRVILPDLRNHGRSPHHPNHSYETLAQDILELILDLHLYKPIIMGHSMGGKVAMYFAFQHPQRVKKLILADISPFSYLEHKDLSGHYSQHEEILEALISVPLETLLSRTEAEEKISTRIPSPGVRRFLLKNLERNKDGSFKWMCNVGVLKNSLSAIVGGISIEELKSNPLLRDIPMLLIKGGQSEYVPDFMIEQLKSLFPQIQVAEIAGAGHWLHAEQPEVFLKILKNFLSPL